MAAQQPKPKEVPQYQLTEPAYMHDVLWPEGAAVFYDGIPGAHMEPLNDAARAMVALHKPQRRSPIDELTQLLDEANQAAS